MTRTASAVTEARPKSGRLYNFSAGPATLPEEVLRQAQEDIWNIFDSGVGIMEHSHRGKVFDRVINEAIEDCRSIAGLDESYEVLFLQGGATLQFAMIPMNFRPEGGTADYLVTGEWAKKAYKEAKLLGDANVAFDSEGSDFDHTPRKEEIALTPHAAYLHYCANNTIYGTQYPESPSAPAGVPLISDTSSEMLSRRFDFRGHAMIYAGAQKNLGPSGVVLVIMRKDFLAIAKDDLPSLLSYRKIAEKGSRLNTPPTFGIYFMGQVFKWILRQGGLDAVERHNNEKAKLLYDEIDATDFYSCPAMPECRSKMNVCFRSPSPELDAKFIDEAKKHDMDGIKGYRTVGGMRASIYNAFPVEGCRVLAQFMREFASRNG